MPRHKRCRGAPLGNQNARKHGFYAAKLNPQESLEFWNMVNVRGINPVTLALHMKIANAVQNAPGNTRVLMEASRLLAKVVLSQNSLTPAEYTAVKKMVRDLVASVANKNGKMTEQFVAESLERLKKRPNK